MAGAGEEWAISIQRSAGQEPFAAEEVERLKLLSQGISSAVAVANALGFARAEAALAAFDMSNRAVLVLDQRGHVTLMNASADRLFCGDVHLLGGRLFCRDASARKALDGAVHTVCAGASGAATLMPVRIPRQEAAPIVAYVTPARGVALDLFSKCRAFVILVDPLDRRVPSPELLQKVFPLTPTEARLAHFLTKGHKLHDLSAKGGFSYETGRNHLKSIFAKLGVNSQADLVAILVSIAAPLGLS